MDHISRKELKTDQVSETASNVLEWSSSHRSLVMRWVGIVAGVAVLALVVHFYRQYQSGVRQQALAKAIRVDDATTGANIQPALQHFDTDEEKAKAWTAAFTDVATKYSGSAEGGIAELYLAGSASEKGDLPQAEKRYAHVVDSAPEEYAALARIALADVFTSQGKTSDAEKVLRDAVAHPAATVSKEQATLALGKALAKTNPSEARKLIQPLIAARTTISRAAVTVMSALPPDPTPGKAEK